MRSAAELAHASLGELRFSCAFPVAGNSLDLNPMAVPLLSFLASRYSCILHQQVLRARSARWVQLSSSSSCCPNLLRITVAHALLMQSG
jgi:hypothetical protein